jgi:hypothetical protein
MSLTLTISGVPDAIAADVDLAAVARALRPLLAPALIGAAELAGLAPVVPVLVSIAVRAALVGPIASARPAPAPCRHVRYSGRG